MKSKFILLRHRITRYFQQIPIDQKTVLGILLFYPVVFDLILLLVRFLGGWAEDHTDLVDYRYRLFFGGLIVSLFFGIFYFLPLRLLWSRLKGMKLLGASVFVGIIWHGVVTWALLPALFWLEVAMHLPFKMGIYFSPNIQLQAVLYQTYEIAHGIGDAYGTEYIVAVEGEKFKRKILYVSSDNCERPDSITWKDNNTIIVDAQEITLQSKPIRYIPTGGLREEPMCSFYP